MPHFVVEAGKGLAKFWDNLTTFIAFLIFVAMMAIAAWAIATGAFWVLVGLLLIAAPVDYAAQRAKILENSEQRARLRRWMSSPQFIAGAVFVAVMIVSVAIMIFQPKLF